MLYDEIESHRLRELRNKKLTWEQKEELSLKIEEEVFYDLLLEFSEREGFIGKMETLYLSIKSQMKETEVEKP